MTELQRIKDKLLNQAMPLLDAIQAVEALGYAPKEAEMMVTEWNEEAED